jgi:hypothetical protein
LSSIISKSLPQYISPIPAEDVFCWDFGKAFTASSNFRRA